MSRFTGKSDFCDLVENASHIEDFYMFKDTHIYMNNAEVRIDDKKELYQFYPFLIGSMAAEKLNDSHTAYNISLTKEPYWDIRERESLGWYVRDFLYFHKRWTNAKKRKKFHEGDTVEDFLEFRYSIIGDKSSFDENAFDKVAERMMKIDDLKDFYFLDVIKVEYNTRLKFLQLLVDEYLSGIHINSYQRQRKEFLDWYEQQGAENTSIIRHIRFQLMKGFK